MVPKQALKFWWETMPRGKKLRLDVDLHAQVTVVDSELLAMSMLNEVDMERHLRARLTNMISDMIYGDAHERLRKFQDALHHFIMINRLSPYAVYNSSEKIDCLKEAVDTGEPLLRELNEIISNLQLPQEY